MDAFTRRPVTTSDRDLSIQALEDDRATAVDDKRFRSLLTIIRRSPRRLGSSGAPDAGGASARPRVRRWHGNFACTVDVTNGGRALRHVGVPHLPGGRHR